MSEKVRDEKVNLFEDCLSDLKLRYNLPCANSTFAPAPSKYKLKAETYAF